MTDTAGSRVGIVVVSHSAQIARGVVELAAQMAPGIRLIAAGGMADGSIGTDAALIADAISQADSGAGVLVLADLGSAVLSTTTALELMVDPDLAARARVSEGMSVAGAIAAAVQANLGSSMEEVEKAARGETTEGSRGRREWPFVRDGGPQPGGPAWPLGSQLRHHGCWFPLGGFPGKPDARLGADRGQELQRGDAQRHGTGPPSQGHGHGRGSGCGLRGAPAARQLGLPGPGRGRHNRARHNRGRHNGGRGRRESSRRRESWPSCASARQPRAPRPPPRALGPACPAPSPASRARPVLPSGPCGSTGPPHPSPTPGSSPARREPGSWRPPRTKPAPSSRGSRPGSDPTAVRRTARSSRCRRCSPATRSSSAGRSS